jgi:hypothetical protein
VEQDDGVRGSSNSGEGAVRPDQQAVVQASVGPRGGAGVVARPRECTKVGVRW